MSLRLHISCYKIPSISQELLEAEALKPKQIPSKENGTNLLSLDDK